MLNFEACYSLFDAKMLVAFTLKLELGVRFYFSIHYKNI